MTSTVNRTARGQGGTKRQGWPHEGNHAAEVTERRQEDALTGKYSIVADVDRVRRRIERNPRHYQRLCDMAREHAAKGRRFSPQLWREFHSDHDLADEQGGNFRVSNSDVAIYARFLLRDVPEARNVIVLRRSKYDPVFEGRANA